ncbi:MAG: sensor histidine kinase [Sphingobium sp.]|uniref:sensor histidine kinase n=1 Tax=Sphingobium sp. TaxID=1912891 RepID=UPI0029B9BB5F|nr:sensor histidine kinase [Sphingobium sp.]MDX3911461.1 sensor histidine kinase [Sphingobium sp.]
MFFILTLALFPLGLVALLASLQAIRTSDAERRAILQMEAMQSVRSLTAEFAADRMALQIGANALGRAIEDPRQCARLDSFMRAGTSLDTRFEIFDRSGRRICATHGGSSVNLPAGRRFSGQAVELLPEHESLLVRTPVLEGSMIGLVFYGRDHLNQIANAAAALTNRRTILAQGTRQLALNATRAPFEGGTLERVSSRVDGTDLTLILERYLPPKTVARMLLLFLPVLMWIAAAAIGWFVVNRLLIQPLVMLRRAVAAYQPGVVLEPFARVRTPAQEIADLGETFRAISEDVATHEAEMAESLVRQRKLTREVHHRVKNNLQIIASLINLHSRSAATSDAVDAYSSIQRRVDALSVVHRNHYAELEENRGVSIRPLISELSASLRATAPESGARLKIQIDSADLHVSQDVAVPVAFLTTELVELAMLCDSGPTISISVQPREDEPNRAQLRVESEALRTTPSLQSKLEGRFDRVLTGLSRQLRSPLKRDEEEGVFCIDIAVLD